MLCSLFKMMTSSAVVTWFLCVLCAELAEGGVEHAEAAEPRQAARAEQEELGAGDSKLQGRSSEAAQDHLPAREGA